MQRTTLGVAGVDAAERFDVIAAAALDARRRAAHRLRGAADPGRRARRPRRARSWLIAVGTRAHGRRAGHARRSRRRIGGRDRRAHPGRRGDATVFISVMRLVNSWFRGRIVPQLSQWVGNIGQLGQVLSAIPFASLLHAAGWTPAFLSPRRRSRSSRSSASLVAIARPPGGATDGAAAGHAGRRAAAAAREPRAGRARSSASGRTSSRQSSGTVFSAALGLPVPGLGARLSTRPSASAAARSSSWSPGSSPGRSSAS